MASSPTCIEDKEVLVYETCLGFFSNGAEFEGHPGETGHNGNAVILRAVSTTKAEDKAIVIFEIPQ